MLLVVRQWGKVPGYSHDDWTAKYPITFDKILCAFLTYYNDYDHHSPGDGNNDFIYRVTKSSLSGWNDNNDGSYWIAIGY